MLRLAFLERYATRHRRRLRGSTKDRHHRDQDKERINQRLNHGTPFIFQFRGNDEVVGVSMMRFHNHLRANALAVPMILARE